MNPYTAVIAQQQLEQLRAEAAEQRLTRAARASADPSARGSPRRSPR